MGIIDLIQLHGHEDNAYIKQLKQSVQMPIIKAIKVIERMILITWIMNAIIIYWIVK